MAAEPPLEFFPEKYFQWEKIHNANLKTGILKKKEKKKNKFNPRFVILHYNYLAYYKVGKGKDGEPTDKNAFAKGVIPLEKVKDASQIQFFKEKDSDPDFTFRVPLDDEVIFFSAETESIMNSWIFYIKQQVEHIKGAPRRGHVEVTMNKLKEVTKIFPENSFNAMVPNVVSPEQAEKYFADMKKFKQEFKTWEPFVRALTLFAEFQSGRVKGYAAWFTHNTKGVQETLNKSEESVLRDWETLIKECPNEMLKASEASFFREDLLVPIDKCERALKLIDLHHRFRREFYFDESIKFEEERETIEAWRAKLESYPPVKSITFEGYANSIISSDTAEEVWIWDQANQMVKRTRFVPPKDNPYYLQPGEVEDPIEFVCKDHPFQFIEPKMYGFVLWNNKSFVWTHPRCPFLIRYDWYESKKVFKQYISKLPPTNANSKTPVRQAPALTDWQLSGGVLRAVTVGERDPTPEIPDVTEWGVKGNIPPPALLIIATFHPIRAIVREILGLSQRPQPGFIAPSGLNPIF